MVAARTKSDNGNSNVNGDDNGNADKMSNGDSNDNGNGSGGDDGIGDWGNVLSLPCQNGIRVIDKPTHPESHLSI